MNSPWKCAGASRHIEDSVGQPVALLALTPDHKTNGAVIAAAPELLEACKVVKAFLDKLEDGTDKNDPLAAIRKRIHAPLRAALEPAIAKAEGRQ